MRSLLSVLTLSGLLILACSGSDKDADTQADDSDLPGEESDTDTDADTDADTDTDVGTLVINEILGKYGPDPDAPVVNEDGEAVDWIELYNPSSQIVSLSGWGLKDGGLEAPWILDVELDLAPGQRVVVLADDGEDSTPGYLHAAFKIGSDGETIELYDPSGALIDAADFPGYAEAEEEGLSYARVPDGGAWADDLQEPTPAASNGER